MTNHDPFPQRAPLVDLDETTVMHPLTAWSHSLPDPIRRPRGQARAALPITPLDSQARTAPGRYAAPAVTR